MRENKFWIFSGTIGRLAYFINTVLLLGMVFLSSATVVHSKDYVPNWVHILLSFAYLPVIVFLVIAIFSNAAKRIRDFLGPGQSVWKWILFLMIPIVGIYFLIPMYFRGRNVAWDTKARMN